MKLLLKDFSSIEMLRGASQPFETIGILIQRIHMQCDMFPLVRPLIELIFHTIRVFGFFIVKQYGTMQSRDEGSEIDSMLPSNIQVAAIK